MKNRPRHICRGRFLLYTAAWHIIWRESHSPNRHPTISQIFQQPRSNHNTTILRVESKNDFDSTIPHSRFSKSDNVELHALGSPINCLGYRVASCTIRDAKEIAKLLAMVVP